MSLIETDSEKDLPVCVQLHIREELLIKVLGMRMIFFEGDFPKISTYGDFPAGQKVVLPTNQITIITRRTKQITAICLTKTNHADEPVYMLVIFICRLIRDRTV